MATWELPSWVVSYLPINTVVLKNIQILFLTKGEGIFQIFLLPLLQANKSTGLKNENRHRFL